MGPRFRGRPAHLAFPLAAFVASTGCNALIGATDPLPQPEDAGGTDATVGAMDSTPSGMDSTSEAPPSSTCTEGTRSCAPDGWTLICEDGGWIGRAKCPSACDRDSGICGDCAPPAKLCTDAGAVSCSSDGTWGLPTACPNVCLDGECAGSCPPGTEACVPLWSYKTCDNYGQWGMSASCPLPNEICRADAAICANAIHDVGWDSALTGTSPLMPDVLYLVRLPPLGHGATLRLFGAWATAIDANGSNAKMALYADDGSGNAPTGKTVAWVASALGLSVGQQSEQIPDSADHQLTSGTYYWLGIVVDKATSVAWAADPNGKVATYQPRLFGSGFPDDLTHATFTDLPAFDLGIFINVQDTD